jgi:hypothetical protein
MTEMRLTITGFIFLSLNFASGGLAPRNNPTVKTGQTNKKQPRERVASTTGIFDKVVTKFVQLNPGVGHL